MMRFFKFIAGFFCEDNGNPSNVRLRVTINNCAAVSILLGGAFKVNGSSLDMAMITAASILLGGAVAEKQIAKSQEQKVPVPSGSDPVQEQ